MDLTARIWVGSAHAVGRINFAGHSGINDSTLRRAMTIYERDLLDVGQLRRSLARINDIGVFEPLTLADISVAHRDDGVTADLTIPLRERKRRWWSVSGPMLPGIGMLQASVSSRLPPWGRGVFEATTYFVSLNVAGIREAVPGAPAARDSRARAALGFRGLTGAVAAGDADALRTHAPRAPHWPHARWPTRTIRWRCRSRRPELEAEPLICVPPKATPLVAAPRRSSRRQVALASADPLSATPQARRLAGSAPKYADTSWVRNVTAKRAPILNVRPDAARTAKLTTA